ncbi:MAG: methyltransferase [Actinomycetia bacterium]|nr:methyltransferase [Actinomycetes bacterium]
MVESRSQRRGGGRLGRIAQKAAHIPTELRPVRPGMSGGHYRPLTEGQCQDVYNTAIDLLETVGMGSPIREFVDVVTAAGGWADGDRLYFPRGVVEGAIATAAKEFVWHGWDDDRSLEIGGDRVHLGTGGAAVLVLDHETRQFRPSTSRDLYDMARLVDTLDNIHFFVRTCVTRDIEDFYDVDLNTAYVCAAGTTKPIGSSFFNRQHVYEIVDMYDHMLGGEGRFAKRPFMVANNTFVVPPLRFAEESAECMVAQVETGMPIDLLSAGQAGATSPAALAGSLAQALAECLAALTVVNLMKPGHPCIMGLWPFVSDLRTGAMSGGGGEEGVLNAAAAQVVNWLGLPSGVAAGMSDSKVPDNQAGYEKGINITLAAQAGANCIYESAGMLASLLAVSPEALVIDNDMMGSIKRTIRGIEINPDTLSRPVFSEVVAGPGHFLGHSQTLEMMNTEYIYPDIGDRRTPTEWTDAGALDMASAAHARVQSILASHHPGHISPEVDASVRERWPMIVDLSG